MADQKAFTKPEIELLSRAMDIAIQSYSRAQKQRPEFAQVAKQQEDQFRELQRKIQTL